jgi:hypothetical protein
MKKLLMLTLLIGAATLAKAQTTNSAVTEHDPATRAKDSTVKATIIDPAQQAASGGAPDWAALAETITQKYDAVTADRTVTKAKIYFYYYNDWPAFCAAIVHYTDNFELANDYKLLNGNAGMILKNSNDPAQLKEAQRWAKIAAAGDGSNAEYQTTYQAITAKLAGK